MPIFIFKLRECTDSTKTTLAKDDCGCCAKNVGNEVLISLWGTSEHHLNVLEVQEDPAGR